MLRGFLRCQVYLPTQHDAVYCYRTDQPYFHYDRNDPDRSGRTKKTPLYRFHRYDLLFGLSSKGFYQGAFSGYYMLICLMGFIAFFAISLGAVIWVLISEVFPNNVRSKGQVLGSMTHWVWSALLSWMFPVFIRTGGTFIFSFFAIMMFLSFFFALRLPETKNKSLEQIQKELTN